MLYTELPLLGIDQGPIDEYIGGGVLPRRHWVRVQIEFPQEYDD